MTDKKSTIRELFKLDQQHVEKSYIFFEQLGMLHLYEQIESLFDTLLESVGRKLSAQGDGLFIRKNADGSESRAWDWFLRTIMLLSAQEQFLTAAQQLFRVRTFQVFGHVRRAIEGAGIAYLSLKEPDLGDLFVNSDRQNFRRRTKTKNILPDNDPLTSQLNNSIDFASSLLHNNYISIASRFQQELRTESNKEKFVLHLDYYPIYQDHLGSFVNIALWLLRAVERVALLLAASFEIDDKQWHEAHQRFKHELDILYIKHDALIRAEC